jgi:hypothetical protein
MRSKRYCFVSLVGLLLFAGLCFAQEARLLITGMNTEPPTARPGDNVLLSCRVVHSAGLENIERVAATVIDTERTTTFTTLYDDGTHGDKSAQDGVYSLLITVSKNPGGRRIVFHAMDKQRHEVDSEPVFLTVKQGP